MDGMERESDVKNGMRKSWRDLGVKPQSKK